MEMDYNANVLRIRMATSLNVGKGDYKFRKKKTVLNPMI